MTLRVFLLLSQPKVEGERLLDRIDCATGERRAFIHALPRTRTSAPGVPPVLEHTLWFMFYVEDYATSTQPHPPVS